jgi:hypothetical protein
MLAMSNARDAERERVVVVHVTAARSYEASVVYIAPQIQLKALDAFGRIWMDNITTAR